MQLPTLSDTIVAVSTGWEPASLGVVRLSGPESFAIAAKLCGDTNAAAPTLRTPAVSELTVRLDDELSVPATVFWFAGPRSFTGQDVVELHTTGCAPLLRPICDRCLALGARRALPGEFTSRAYVAGKLDRSQVDGVLRLIHAANGASARNAARSARGDSRRQREALFDRLVRLLALIEAGIDFVEEEDVRFISTAEVLAELDALLEETAPDSRPDGPGLWSGRPHVALVGRPNAGKSTLLNALLGYERAIVSPIVGTTRDVLSAELTIGGVTIVLQDCAGLGDTADDLEAAAHCATESAADLADLVLWVHAQDCQWSDAERAGCDRIPADRRMLVIAKTDAAAAPRAGVPAFAKTVLVCAISGTGLDALRDAVAQFVASRPGSAAGDPDRQALAETRRSIERAREAAAAEQSLPAELVALELRAACTALQSEGAAAIDEEVLGRIFGEFCIGK